MKVEASVLFGDRERRSKFTESLIVGILTKGGAGLPSAEACRKHRICSALYYQWKSRCSDLTHNLQHDES